MISNEDLLEGVRRLGIPIQDNTIQFGSESEMDILVDFCIHAILDPDGRSLAERTLGDPDAPLNEYERQVLTPLAHSRFMIFEAIHAEPGVGVHVRNLLAPEAVPFLLADYRFSQTVTPGLRMAGRIAFLPEFALSTGACLPLGSLSHSLPDLVRRAMAQAGAMPNAAGEFDREADAKLHELVMSMLIEAGQGEAIAYRKLPSTPVPGRHTRAGKAGKVRRKKR